MRATKARAQKRPLFIFDSRFVIALSGLFLSVVLHELFHIAAHWGHIVDISFFNGNGSIVAMSSITPIGYDVQLEEAIAYSITLVTMFITIILVCKVHDDKDTRTAHETLGAARSTELAGLLF